jgi:hypothetical protein
MAALERGVIEPADTALHPTAELLFPAPQIPPVVAGDPGPALFEQAFHDGPGA